MKFIKLGLLVAVTVALTCVVVFTFMQEPFKETAAVKLLFTEPEFPIYVFALATFALGLLMGFAVALYCHITGFVRIGGKKKEIKRLEGVIKEMEGELARLRPSVAGGSPQNDAADKPQAEPAAPKEPVEDKDRFA